MPYYPRKKTTGLRKKKGMVMIRKRRGQMVGGANIAKLTETIQLNDINASSPYDAQVNLTQFPRAVSVAQSYQQYRITKVEYRYKPLWDTYTAADISGTTLPYLYSIMNRNGSSPGYFDQNWLVAQGAKGRRLDDKVLKVVYKPNILLAGVAYNVSGAETEPTAQIKISPWLPTQALPQQSGGTAAPGQITGGTNDTLHYGHSFFIEMEGTKIKVSQFEVVAHFEFKQPYAPPPANPNVNGEMVAKTIVAPKVGNTGSA